MDARSNLLKIGLPEKGLIHVVEVGLAVVPEVGLVVIQILDPGLVLALVLKVKAPKEASQRAGPRVVHAAKVRASLEVVVLLQRKVAPGVLAPSEMMKRKVLKKAQQEASQGRVPSHRAHPRMIESSFAHCTESFFRDNNAFTFPFMKKSGLSLLFFTMHCVGSLRKLFCYQGSVSLIG